MAEGRRGGYDVHGTSCAFIDSELIDGFGAVGVELAAVACEVENGAAERMRVVSEKQAVRGKYITYDRCAKGR